MRRVFAWFPCRGGWDAWHGTVTGVNLPGTQRGLFVLKDNGDLTFVARDTHKRMWCLL